MSLLVQKYGGTSVADVACMKCVAQNVYETQKKGHSVVVVVSAMGKTTDNLVVLAKEVNPRPDNREMDMLLASGEQISVAVLAMTLHAMGAEAVSMTGPQAGIFTDHVHAKAKIVDIKPERIFRHLDKARIVIVAGFQGLTPSQEIATLGRGGSDTTAVALAAALKADRCQIFTDVDGIYTADPRVVKKARRLDEISYDEMLELASLGAKVLQSRAVEFAKKYNVMLEVLSSFHSKPGTLVREEVTDMEKIVVRGVAADKDQAKITLQSVLDQPGVAANLFKELAAANINVDMIVQNVSQEGHTDISFTVPVNDLNQTKDVVEKLLASVDARGMHIDESIAKVSIVGVGMKSHSGVAYRMFKTLAENSINIEMISTSEIKISVVIQECQADEAVQILHTVFELDQAPAEEA
ncbi:MAG: aspartate kinase [Kiritimatiellae bacterium]|nr:aspartate kinase [Kiritimatiellia bacterium]